MMVKELESREKEPRGKIVFLFDVDGVLTDKRKVNLEVLAEIARLLENSPIGLITGRSIAWLSERVLTKLENQGSNTEVLNNLFVLAEKGAVLLEYQNGQRKIKIDRRIRIPKVISQKARKLAGWKEFAPYLFFDETKQTMVSIEMHEEGDFEKQKRALGKMTSLLEKMVVDQGLGNRLEVVESTIATDVQSKAVGKGFATGRAWSLLQRRRIACHEILAFGDSKEDLEIGEELVRLETPFRFVLVGPELLRRVGFPIIYTLELYDKGVLSYLRSLRQE